MTRFSHTGHICNVNNISFLHHPVETATSNCVYNTAINTELIIFASSGKALDGNIMYSRIDICQA